MKFDIRSLIAICGLLLIFIVPYFHAQDTKSLIPAALLLLYFIPTFFLLSTKEERAFMLAVLFIAAIAETLNVSVGAYTYLGTRSVPQWVLIGWVCTAWALINLNKLLPVNKNMNASLGLIILVFAIYALFVSHSIEGFVVNAAVISAVFYAYKPKSYNIFLIAVAFGMIIELSGVFLFGAWSYAMGPDLANLGAMYAFIYFVASMLARYEL